MRGPGGRKPWPWAVAGAGPVSVSWLAAVVLAVVLLGWPAAVTALAAEPDTFMAGEHWADIDQFLLGQQTAGEPVTFTDLVSALAEGRGKEAGQVLLALLEATLIREIRPGTWIPGNR